MKRLLFYEDKQFGMEKYSIRPDKTNFRYKGQVIVREMREGSPIAYVWGREITSITNKYEVDERGWIHINEFTEKEIRELLGKVISMRDKIK